MRTCKLLVKTVEALVTGSGPKSKTALTRVYGLSTNCSCWNCFLVYELQDRESRDCVQSDVPGGESIAIWSDHSHIRMIVNATNRR